MATKTTKTTKTVKAEKTEAKPAKTARAAVSVKAVKAEEKSAGLSVPVYGADGKAAGHVTLPPELFDAVVNEALMAQAVRVYLANQREGSAASKTRGKVEGSSRKIYKQKGTGRARHGSIRAPIFVGGGVVFGPEPRDYSLSLSKAMKRRALESALTDKRKQGGVVVVDGLETLEPKTKLIANALKASAPEKRVLFAVTAKAEGVKRAARNIAGVDILKATDLNPYAVVTHTKLVVMKSALEEMKKHFIA